MLCRVTEKNLFSVCFLSLQSYTTGFFGLIIPFRESNYPTLFFDSEDLCHACACHTSYLRQHRRRPCSVIGLRGDFCRSDCLLLGCTGTGYSVLSSPDSFQFRLPPRSGYAQQTGCRHLFRLCLGMCKKQRPFLHGISARLLLSLCARPHGPPVCHVHDQLSAGTALSGVFSECTAPSLRVRTGSHRH